MLGEALGYLMEQHVRLALETRPRHVHGMSACSRRDASTHLNPRSASRFWIEMRPPSRRRLQPTTSSSTASSAGAAKARSTRAAGSAYKSPSR